MELVKSVSIDNFVNQRQAILDLIGQAKEILNQADDISKQAGFGEIEGICLEPGSRFGTRLFDDRWQDKIVKEIDRVGWRYLMNESGMKTLMDAETKNKWDAQLEPKAKDVPELNLENIEATFGRLHQDKAYMFETGVVNLFRSLSWDYKTNCPRMFGKKIIVDNFCRIEFYGFSWNHWGSTDKVIDLERIMCLLDKQPVPDHRHALRYRMFDSDVEGNAIKNGNYEDKYFKIKCYQKGTAHITFKRSDLVERLNTIIAKHHPNALPAK